MSENSITLAAFIEFLNAVEAGIAAAKNLISEKKKLECDPESIKWEQTQGNRGPYERSSDINNPDFKALLKELASHEGRITQNSYFYWVFKNGSTIGRKKQATAENHG
jgi:hypothetical protein